MSKGWLNMKTCISFDQLNEYLLLREDEKEALYDKRFDMLIDLFSFSKNVVMNERLFSIDTMLSVVEKNAKNIKLDHSKLRGKWEVTIVLKNMEVIEKEKIELVDGLWNAVCRICDITIQNEGINSFIQNELGFNKAFPYPISSDLGNIVVDINGGQLLVEEKNVGDNKFIFFFMRNEDKFWKNKDNKDMVNFFVSRFVDKAIKENMSSVILQYENLNNSIFPSNLDELGFERYEQDGIYYGSSFLFLNKAPKIFNHHLPRGFYLKEIKKNTKSVFLQNILDKLAIEFNNMYADNLCDDLFVEHSGEEYRISLKREDIGIRFTVNKKVKYQFKSVISHLFDFNDSETTQNFKIDQLVSAAKYDNLFES
jgi:hypothetical protein